MKDFAEVGGLMSYSPDTRETTLRSLVYVDRILRGDREGARAHNLAVRAGAGRPGDRVMRRRAFVAGAGAALAAPRAAGAQQAGKVYRIGWLAPIPRNPDPRSTAGWLVRRAGELGWIEGQNVSFEYRAFRTVAEADRQAEELARMNVDLIIAQAPPAILAARRATRTIPIVMLYAGDVIAMGIATNLGRPGGNVTGLSYDAGHEWAGKAIQLMRELFPRASRVAYLWNVENDSHAPTSPYRREIESVAPALGFQVLNADVRTTADIRPAIRRAAEARAEAIFVSPDPFTIRNRGEIMEQARQHGLPAVVGGDWGFEGAVLVYGPRTRHIPPRAAEYIDRILRGAKPGDLPIEQPTAYDLIVDLRAAKRLGLTIAPSLLLRADRVIE